MEDIELLRQYVESRSDAAFAALFSRHVNLVYSAALRKTGNPHAAEEIVQAVFIVLARKAQSLSDGAVLSCWLYQTTRLTTANYLRMEYRRARREQMAVMEAPSIKSEPDLWAQIAPLLENAMGQLGENDRTAIVLRFFEGKSLKDVGAALGAGADAAKMRVNRAVKKLRASFEKQGVTLSDEAVIQAVSANAVRSAPAALSVAVLATFTKGTSTGGSANAAAITTLRNLRWMELKTAVAVAAALAIAGGTIALKVARPDYFAAKSASISSSGQPVLIEPKLSVGGVRANMTIQQVVAALGEPDRRTGRILHYVRSGFSVIPNTDNDGVRSVFCGDTLGVNSPMARAFKGRTREGIGIGSSRAEIIKAFGEPTSSNLSRDVETMQYPSLSLSLALYQGKAIGIVVDL